MKNNQKQEIENGLRKALRWPKEMDILATDGDSRGSIERAVEFISILLARQKERLIEKVEKSKTTNYYKVIEELKK